MAKKKRRTIRSVLLDLEREIRWKVGAAVHWRAWEREQGLNEALELVLDKLERK